MLRIRGGEQGIRVMPRDGRLQPRAKGEEVGPADGLVHGQEIRRARAAPRGGEDDRRQHADPRSDGASRRRCPAHDGRRDYLITSCVVCPSATVKG